MEGLDYWRLCDELSVIQAALLIVGVDPATNQEFVRQWDPFLLRGKTVKQAILIWLRRNADQYGLTKDDGSPNEQGIEEVAKIANWDTKGGAPKTPGE